MERSMRSSLTKKSIRWVPDLDVPVSECRPSFTDKSVWRSSEEQYPTTSHSVRLHPGQISQFASNATNHTWSSGSSSSLEVLDAKPPLVSESESSDSSGPRTELTYGPSDAERAGIRCGSRRKAMWHRHFHIRSGRDPRR
ncbi:unnamed protein product [Echinostoma caproni]|uniref:Uncharacterized protein n=1 Tax=Echinostoma caproni TaxID=27848 RepID=A0A183A5X6_9TREM|nr:unnamed protein product [Echinostoma caproni]